MKIRKKSEITLTIILAAVGIMFCLPFLLEGFYALPDGDDFHYMYMTQNYLDQGMNYWQAAIRVTKDCYFNWQGIYTANLIENYLSPFLRGGQWAYSMTCVFLVFSYCAVMYLFTMLICKYILKLKSICAYIFHWDVLMLLSLNLANPASNFYWFSSACGCLVPLIFGILGICVLLVGFEKNCKRHFVFAGVLGMLACGGTLQIACIVCWSYLLFVAAAWLKKKKYIGYLSCFVCAVIATLLNVLAPGNYVRKAEQINADMDLFKAILDMGIAIARALYYIVTTPVFWLALILLILFWTYAPVEKYYRSISNLWIGFLLIGGIGGACALVFPVVFGYGTWYMHDRQLSIFMTCFSIFLEIFMAIVIQRFLDKVLKFRKVSCVVCAFLAIVMIVLPTENYVLRAYRELCSGRPQLSYENWNYIYQTVKESDEDVVYINIDNEFVDDLLVFNTYAHYHGKIFLSPSYITYTGKEDIIIEWNQSIVE